MRNRMQNGFIQKTIVSLFACLLLLTGISVFVYANETESESENTFSQGEATEFTQDIISDDGRTRIRVCPSGFMVKISDGCDLLTEQERILLLDEMEPLGEFANVAFESYSLVYNTTAYADRVYNSAGFFQPGGILFLIDMHNRNLNLLFGGSAKKVLSSSVATSIEDNVYRFASKGDYYQCVSSVFSQVRAKYEGRRIAQPMKLIISLLMGLCLSMMGVFLYARRSRRHSFADGTLLDASIGTAAVAGAAAVTVYKTVNLDSDSGGGGFSGGGGGGFSGGSGHNF